MQESTSQPSIGEMQDAFDELLKEFQKEHGFTDEDMDGLKNDDLEQIVPIFAFSSKSYVTDICRLALANIERFVTSDFYIDLSLIHISEPTRPY